MARAAAGLPFLLECGMEVAFVPPQLDVPRRARVVELAPQGEDEAVVFFEGIDNPDAAFALKGCHCLVRRSELDPANLRIHDAQGLWEGWQVVLQDGELLGIVEGLEERPHQAALAVALAGGQGQGRTVLIPLVEEFLLDVDEEARVIAVSLPEGLVEAQL